MEKTKTKAKKAEPIFKRSSGVLMNISSLPSGYGVGTFGKDAYDFVDFLKETGFSYWQILPLCPVDGGNSPYSSPSAFAGNTLYIDPYLLYEDGYISKETEQANVYHGSPYVADYAYAAEKRDIALAEAYRNIKSKNADIEKLCRDRDLPEEIFLYAEFAARKTANGETAWTEWTCDGFEREEYEKNLISQLLFFEQWAKLKEYANKNGIKIIGDMPIYVSMDSADVWAHRDMFLLGEDNKPEKVAGVPPDYFSEDGQFWGNPIYAWKKHKENGYEWWCKRIAQSLKIYDVLRIDHFRGFASYWSIPGTSQTAKDGKWEKGPGMDLFKAVRNYLAADGELPIIAEDLGVFGEDVVRLLNGTGFPGMRVIQFAFAPGDDSIHLPHNYETNTIAYTGTHDNNTLLGYLSDISKEERDFALAYCSGGETRWWEGGYYAPAIRKMIEAVWRSNSVIAIAPFQDMCGFGADTRMNTPGVVRENWLFRTTKETVGSCDKWYFKMINRVFRRDGFTDKKDEDSV